MISRRLVRIKAVQTYYAFMQGNYEGSTEKVCKALELSTTQSYELFVEMFCLIVATFDFAEKRIENSRKKLVPTESDLNPNLRFIENRVVQAFRAEPTIKRFMDNEKYNWSEHNELVKDIYNKIVNAEFYNKYMTLESIELKDDVDIVVKIINKYFTDNNALDEILETESIFWNDDLELSLSNIIQCVKKINESNIDKFRLPAMYKNEEDEEFGETLIKKTCLNKIKFDSIIESNLKKWELQRIAFLDRVILHLALCEITQFPELPVRVTFNEYIDIAKAYSTEKSGTFINGILDKIYNEAKTNKTLNKVGMGLL